jgi:benzoyl-CoA reductase/2-hydroxyglutaryl-CoA dehydratase subunit BcrC/BadD/HgdB
MSQGDQKYADYLVSLLNCDGIILLFCQYCKHFPQQRNEMPINTGVFVSK